ncbi:DNA-binding protein [Methylomicrobium sp. Wu6]|uniref:DNA-binding protein n=1 Tax=Methylomicrobium sp. Wu6 TaxID=3107928 RepID=UPI002DD62722|nr:DNA-binding protein [Methylomicrobium sp. Wu6]MEC4749863.1 DNA-binding protein [Methylomicrobium sp. Wu6]
MEKRSDTYSLAYECCNSVFLEDGRFPTIDAIRDRIHINSPAVIKRAMNDWTLHFVERHRQKLENPNMPAVIVDASESLWKLAMAEAKKAFDTKEKELSLRESEWKSQIRFIEDKLTENQQKWESENSHLSQALADQISLSHDLTENLKITAQQLKETESSLIVNRENLSRAEGALEEARKSHEAQTREWSEKSEKDHLWHLKRIEEEKEAAKNEQARIIANLNRSLETAKLDQESLRARLTQIMNQVGDQLERQGKLEAEADKLRAALSSLEKALLQEKERSVKLQALVKKQRRPSEKHVSERSVI